MADSRQSGPKDVLWGRDDMTVVAGHAIIEK